MCWMYRQAYLVRGQTFSVAVRGLEDTHEERPSSKDGKEGVSLWMATDRKWFLEAVKTGSAALVAKLLTGIKDDYVRGILINSPGYNRDPDSLQGTPLYWACVHGHQEVAEVLLESGADPDAPATPWGALHLHAACDNNYLSLARLLLSHGCNVNAQSLQGDTACHLAAFRGNLDMLQLLIEYGYDLRIRNDAGKTVLNEACAANHTAVISYLNMVLKAKGLHNGVTRQMSHPAPSNHNRSLRDPEPQDGMAAMLSMTSQRSRPKLRTAMSCPGAHYSDSENKSSPNQSPNIPSQDWEWTNVGKSPPIINSRNCNLGRPSLPSPSENSHLSLTNMVDSCWDDKSNMYQTKTCL